MIPEELGSLSRLQSLDLSSNLLTGAIPAALGNLSELRLLDLSANVLSGRLPSSLVQLTNLRTLNFQDQNVCAPKDDAFQAWLLNIPNTQGPTCVDLQAAGIADQAFTVGAAVPAWQLPEASGGIAPFTYGLTPALPPGLHFDDSTRTISGIPTLAAGSATYTYKVVDASAESDSVTFVIEVVAAVSFADTVADQSFPRTHPIPPLVLPEATGGVPPITYTLTPDLPVGLSYEPVSRTISGTPTVVTPMPVPFAYRATGINGSADSLLFTIEVFSPVNAVHEVLPTEFALQGNYPNPFRHSTRLLLDLPWPANVTVEILDVIGRQMLVVPPQPMAAGWAQSLELAPTMLSSGLYWYRVHASSPNGEAVQAGQFIRIQ